MINVLYLTPWNLGGATSFTVNLAQCFERAGIAYRIVRLAKRTESKKRQIGKYGVYYQNVSFDDAHKGKGVWLLAAAPVDSRLAEQAASLVENSSGACVFHDPNEFKLYPHWSMVKHNRVVCIRQTGLASMPLGKFIEHPYVRVLADSYAPRTKHAVSIARISAVKNSLWIYEANLQLPPMLRVNMVGSLNRFWWNFNVKPKHPDWPMPASAGFAREAGAAARACVGYEYMVDLTVFANDGGGTQYSFLEAIDAGAVPVMTTDWCSYPGIARELGPCVADKTALIELMMERSATRKGQTAEYRISNYAYLDKYHDPVRIANLYCDYLRVSPGKSA